MGKAGKIIVVVLLAAAVMTVMAMKRNTPSGPAAQAGSPSIAAQAAPMPRLVDLGSTTCIPCKMMAPVLEALKDEYVGRMQVDFIDVNVNPDAAAPFAIRVIPTQVFLDAAGKELWRHEGFFSKEDILAKWQELGVSLSALPGTGATTAPANASAVKSGSTLGLK